MRGEITQPGRDEAWNQNTEWNQTKLGLHNDLAHFRDGSLQATPGDMWKMIERVNALLRYSPSPELERAATELRQEILDFAIPVFAVENDENERVYLAALTPEQRLAETLHEQSCHSSHEDICGFYHQDWKNPGYEREDYLGKSQRLLETLGGNEALAIKVIFAIFGGPEE